MYGDSISYQPYPVDCTKSGWTLPLLLLLEVNHMTILKLLVTAESHSRGGKNSGTLMNVWMAVSIPSDDSPWWDEPGEGSRRPRLGTTEVEPAKIKVLGLVQHLV